MVWMVCHSHPNHLYFQLVVFFKVYYKKLLDTPDSKFMLFN